ncbi:Fic/DOC family protein [Aeromicrobium alkaliterrae]
MASTEFVDPYLDPATGILRNKLGATDQIALDQAEGDLVFLRLTKLMSEGVSAPRGDLDEIREIHRTLFQDVYDWAGDIRTVDIRKPGADAQPFLAVSKIELASSYIQGELADEKMLLGLDRDAFIGRISHYYDQFNYMHPFREGNGRTQRVLISRIAHHAGWELDWRQVSGEENDAASRAGAEAFDLQPLHRMFDKIVIGPAASTETQEGAERARSAFGHRAGRPLTPDASAEPKSPSTKSPDPSCER